MLFTTKISHNMNKKLITLSYILAFIAFYIMRSYAIHLYGARCGINLFDPRTWGRVFMQMDLACVCMEWYIRYAQHFMLSTLATHCVHLCYLLKEINEESINKETENE